PKTMVKDLRKIKNKGGVLPNLQTMCLRLYRLAKPRDARSEKWEITTDHYKKVGDPERQGEFYVDEAILTKNDELTPKLSKGEREEELAVWKDLLCGLVVDAPSGGALTRILSEVELRDTGKEAGCRTDFAAMTAYLAAEDQRILREDRRAGGNPQ